MISRRDGDEYVFSFVENGRTIICRAAIGEGDYSIDGNPLALFPDRSSNHKRIAAFLEAQKAVAASK